jgi:hypothetical protein
LQSNPKSAHRRTKETVVLKGLARAMMSQPKAVAGIIKRAAA